MEELLALDPNAWANALITLSSSPVVWIIAGIVVLYIVFNSKAFAALCERTKTKE